MDELEKNLNEEIMAEGKVDTTTQPECQCCCIGSQEITFAPCEDVKDFTVGPYDLKCEGRFLKVRVNLKNVCKNRKINVGVLVCENVDGTFFIRGFKACQVTVSSNIHTTDIVELDKVSEESCTSITVDEFCFVFPDEDLCKGRTFVVKVIAHYADASFQFCPC